MNSENIIRHQLSFYKKGKAGCMFASIAAKNPIEYGWKHVTLDVNYRKIDELIAEAINDPEITTLSLIFPLVVTKKQFAEFIRELKLCKNMFLEQNELFNDYLCLGFRVKVDASVSWVSGFGNFEFLPETRRAPYTELAFRVKPKPKYKWVMKESLTNVLHIADLYLKGISEKKFKRNWCKSFERTEKILGQKPDLRSAAKTTFSIPKDILD